MTAPNRIVALSATTGRQAPVQPLLRMGTVERA
jgi:hypothetical protein